MVFLDKMQQTIEALEAVGFPVCRGFPGRKVPLIYDPQVAVYLGEQTQETLTLVAEVFVPSEHGGQECEETAIRVARVLTEEMAICSVGSCQYSGKTGLFTIRVQAKWYRELDYEIRVDTAAIKHAVSCYAVRSQVCLPYIQGETGEVVVELEGVEWKITVKDLCPMNEVMEEEKQGSFALTVMRPGGLETYPGCVWETVRLEETPAGVIRTRVAVTNREREIGAG